MKRLVLFTLIFLLCSPSLSYPDKKKDKIKLPTEVHRALYKAQQLMNKKEYLQTTEELKKFIHKHTKENHYLIEFTLGNALTMCGKNKEAATHYRAALDLKPDYNPAWMNLGKIYYDLKEYQKAGNALVKGYETSEEKDPKTLYYAANAFMVVKEYQKAEETLKDCLDRHPDIQDHMFEFTLANVLLMNNKKKEAVTHYLATLDLKQDYNPAWMNLGKIYYDLKEYQKAGNALVKGYETSEEKEPGTLFNACTAFLMADKKENAIPYLEILVSGKLGSPKQEWVQSLLMVYVDLKLTKKADQMLERLVDRYGDNPLWWRLSYQFYANQNDYEKAIFSLIIYSYLTTLKRDEIILLGDLLGVIGLPLEAARYYEKALGYDGKPEEYEKLISFLLAGHRLEKARDTLNWALKKNPTAKLCSLLGQIYYKQERYDDALHAFGQSARLDPKNGEYPLMMGYCALQLENKDKALLALKKASQFPGQRKIAKELLNQVASWKER